MKRLLWLEWLVSRQGLIIGSALTLIFFLASCTGHGGYYIYSLPSFIAISVLVRSSMKFEKDAINKCLYLLPLKIKHFVKVKYLFHNILFLISTLIVYCICIFSAHLGMFQQLNFFFVFLNMLFGFFLINLALLGYYLVGVANMQFLMFAGYIAAFWFSKHMVEVMLTQEFIIISLLGLLILVSCFYVLTLRYLNDR